MEQIKESIVDAHTYRGGLHAGEYLACHVTIDPRICIGRRYRVRPTDSEQWLFSGQPVRLIEIRPGPYCFRLRFETGERVTEVNPRDGCVYTDSWQPAALALAPSDSSDIKQRGTQRART